MLKCDWTIGLTWQGRHWRRLCAEQLAHKKDEVDSELTFADQEVYSYECKVLALHSKLCASSEYKFSIPKSRVF